MSDSGDGPSRHHRRDMFSARGPGARAPSPIELEGLRQRDASPAGNPYAKMSLRERLSLDDGGANLRQEYLFADAPRSVDGSELLGTSTHSSRETVGSYAAWSRADKKRRWRPRWPRIRALRAAGYRQLLSDWKDRFAEHVLRRRVFRNSGQGRRLPVRVADSALLLDARTGRRYASNVITSSIYSPLDFLPKQLYAQFSKLANVYFLSISVLQMIPGLSTTGTYTTIIPLLVFISISIAREGFDDWRRHRQDKEENNRRTHRYVSDAAGAVVLEPVKWKHIRVGDILHISQNEWIPADVVLLHCNGIGDQALIETMALDGETNLKTKLPLPELAARCGDPQGLAAIDASLLSEDPNLDLYNYEATVTIDGTDYPLGPGHIIYRGSILRNTENITALAVFTGEETKIRKNATHTARTKAPRLQKRLNRIITFMVMFVAALSFFSFMGYVLEERHHTLWYARRVRHVEIVMGYIIMFNTLIPLSLYVSMEIIKVLQMFLMQNDIDMYHQATDTRCEAHTCTINEELGQISYIFSDKTGTLTDNMMLFRKISVAGQAWLHDLDLQVQENSRLFQNVDAGSMPSLVSSSNHGSNLNLARTSFSTGPPARSKSQLVRNSSIEAGRPLARTSTTWISTTNPTKPQAINNTLSLLKYMQLNPHSMYTKKAKFFLLGLALCHSCLPEKSTDADIDPLSLVYQSASPDELALVEAARDMGFVVIDRQHKSITVRSYPKGIDSEAVDTVYEVVEVIEFSSARKRMSIVIRFPDGRLAIFCKGADNVVLERLKLQMEAKTAAAEIARKATIRKAKEADVVKLKRHATHASLQGRLSLSKRGASIDADATLNSLDNMLRDARNEDVQETRNSFEANNARARKSLAARQSVEARASTSTSHNLVERDDALPGGDFLSDSNVLDDQWVIDQTLQDIDDFSNDGLRTLLYAHKWIDNHEFDAWMEQYSKAKTSLVDRQAKIEEAAEVLENGFDLIGATAIEDKLQDGVPDAIDRFQRAGIKMWMLTGDKRETAINIGYSCRLIKDYSTVVILKDDEGDLQSILTAAESEIDSGVVAHAVVVVDGMTLTVIESDITLMSMFIGLCVKADSVICCRASPAQKAVMVTSVRSTVQDSITLAIGDGANDIAMIRAADVGIGIAGREGLQAARSSDYSFGQFRFLLKLLFVHGRWNYVRTCKYVLGTFYKEIFFYISQAIYQRNTFYTGTSLYENWSLSMFNTLFTSLTVICLGSIEQDLNPVTLIAIPELYSYGRLSRGFNIPKFFYWVGFGAAESVLVSFLTFYVYGYSTSTGFNDIYPFCVLNFTSIVTVIVAKLQFIEMHYICWINVFVFVISVGGWFAWCNFLSVIYKSKPSAIYLVYDAFVDGFGKELSFWVMALCNIVLCLALDYGLHALAAAYYPSDTTIFQILEKRPEIRRKLEQESYEVLQHGWDAGEESSLSNVKFIPKSAKKAINKLSSSKVQRTKNEMEKEREIADIIERRERELEG